MQNFMLLNNTLVGDVPQTEPNTELGSQSAQQTETRTEVATATQTTQAQQKLFGGNTMQMVLMMVVFIGAMYFFTIRPQQKKEQELKDIQSALKSGDWVVTFSGLYGKIVDVGDDVLIVEFGTNKGVKIPVKRSEVTRTTEPSLIKKSDA